MFLVSDLNCSLMQEEKHKCFVWLLLPRAAIFGALKLPSMVQVCHVLKSMGSVGNDVLFCNNALSLEKCKSQGGSITREVLGASSRGKKDWQPKGKAATMMGLAVHHYKHVQNHKHTHRVHK